MPAWRDLLFEPSWRGKPFAWLQADYEHGRRTAEHEFPLSDAALIEDMGRKIRAFTLRGFVVGPDYRAERDALIAANEQKGPGKLVHPIFGEMLVMCISANVSESTDAGGKATFTWTFKGAGGKFDPNPSTNTAAKVGQAGDVAAGAAGAAGAAKVITSGSQGLISSLKSSISSVLDPIKSTLLGLKADVADQFTWVGQLEQLRNDVFAGGSELTGVLHYPGQLFTRMVNLVQSVSPTALLGSAGLGSSSSSGILGLFGLGSVNFSNLLGSLGWGSARTYAQGFTSSGTVTPAKLASSGAVIVTPAPATFTSVRVAHLAIADAMPIVPVAKQVGSTPDLTKIAVNDAAVKDAVRQVALTEAANAAASETFSSADAALAVRDDLADRLDAELRYVTDPNFYAALATLRAALMQHLDDVSIRLPRLATIVLPAVTPALVVAYRLYDDASDRDAIAARNHVGRPGFLPGGAPLQVLSDAGAA